MRVVMLDNHDSFVYNLADALVGTGASVEVYRNSLPLSEVLGRLRDPDAEPPLVCLSPGPGTPQDAGCLMDLVAACLGREPLLGICLGFQAMLAHAGASVGRVGPTHGSASDADVTGAGRPVLLGTASGSTARIARYHSLGTREVPDAWVPWAFTDGIVMAAAHTSGKAVGFQFHPESVLTPGGTGLLSRTLEWLARGSAPVLE